MGRCDGPVCNTAAAFAQAVPAPRAPYQPPSSPTNAKSAGTARRCPPGGIGGPLIRATSRRLGAGLTPSAGRRLEGRARRRVIMGQAGEHVDWETLRPEAAVAATANSYSPYSNFPVRLPDSPTTAVWSPAPTSRTPPTASRCARVLHGVGAVRTGGGRLTAVYLRRRQRRSADAVRPLPAVALRTRRTRPHGDDAGGASGPWRRYCPRLSGPGTWWKGKPTMAGDAAAATGVGVAKAGKAAWAILAAMGFGALIAQMFQHRHRARAADDQRIWPWSLGRPGPSPHTASPSVPHWWPAGGWVTWSAKSR